MRVKNQSKRFNRFSTVSAVSAVSAVSHTFLRQLTHNWWTHKQLTHNSHENSSSRLELKGTLSASTSAVSAVSGRFGRFPSVFKLGFIRV